jgi:hypothetical protein
MRETKNRREEVQRKIFETHLKNRSFSKKINVKTSMPPNLKYDSKKLKCQSFQARTMYKQLRS